MDVNALVEEHLGLVKAIASKLVGTIPSSLEFDDLVGFGQQGLVQAAQRYDPDRGVAFTTFAYYRIRGSIFDGARKMTGGAGSRRIAFEEHADDYLEQLGSEPAPPTATAAAERLAGAVADLAVAYVACSEQIEEAADTTLPDPADVAERMEQLSRVRQEITKLPDRERELLELMYFEGRGLVDAGSRLGMSRGWASRLHTRALRRLREGAETPPDRGPPPGSNIRV